MPVLLHFRETSSFWGLFYKVMNISFEGSSQTIEKD
jgi:hypothetical protein